MKPSFLKPIIKSMISAIAIWSALIAVAAFLLTKTDDPSKFTDMLWIIILPIGAFFAGRIASTDTENKLLVSFISGIFTALPLFLVTLILGDIEATTVLRLSLCILFTVIGFTLKKDNSTNRSSAKKRKAIAKKYSV